MTHYRRDGKPVPYRKTPPKREALLFVGLFEAGELLFCVFMALIGGFLEPFFCFS